MSVTVIVELTIKQELVDGYCTRLQTAFPETRAFPGCEDIAAYRDQAQPNRIVVIERWASQASYERYVEWRRGQGVFDRLATISESPMRVRFLDAVAS